MEEAQRLVLAPFEEIVEKGKNALENAGDGDSAESKQMQKAAKNLVREGERALAKIAPLCKSRLDEFGSVFVDALKEHGMSPLTTMIPIALTLWSDKV
jgi:hypothetical protein